MHVYTCMHICIYSNTSSSRFVRIKLCEYLIVINDDSLFLLVTSQEFSGRRQEFCCVVDKQSRGGGGKKMSLDVSSHARCCMRLWGDVVSGFEYGNVLIILSSFSSKMLEYFWILDRSWIEFPERKLLFFNY